MTDINPVNASHRLDARFNAAAAALLSLWGLYALWNGADFLLHGVRPQSQSDMSSGDHVLNAMLAVLVAFAVAQCVAGYWLLRRRQGARWFGVAFGVLAVGLVPEEHALIGLVMCGAIPVLIVRTWHFDPRKVSAAANAVMDNANVSLEVAGPVEGATGGATAWPTRMRYCGVFASVFCAVYFPGLLVVGTGRGNSAFLLTVASGVAWWVSCRKVSPGAKEDVGAYALAAVVPAALLAGIGVALARVTTIAVSISGSGESVNGGNALLWFAGSWVLLWLASFGVQYALSGCFGGVLRTARA